MSNVDDASMSPGASVRGWVGATNPPGPTLVAAGSATPDAVTVTCGESSSVVVRLVVEPPGRNSATFPLTVTASPTDTVGRRLVKTCSPSLVAGSASGVASWIQKPLLATAVTTPVVLTRSPVTGEGCPAPWISWTASWLGVGVGDGDTPPELRGLGAPATKSTELLSVSVPWSERRSAVVLLSPGAATPSKSFAVPYPMKSLTSAVVE